MKMIFLLFVIFIFNLPYSSAQIPDTLWIKTFGVEDNGFSDISVISYNEFIIAGETILNEANYFGVWILRFESEIPTYVSSEKIIPYRYALFQNYPNPFNPTTNFELRIVNMPTGKADCRLILNT